MKTVRIYKNEAGVRFTLESYDKVSGPSFANNIVLDKEVDKLTARAMHSNGSLHYIFGIGDRKELTGKLKRGKQYGNFKIN